MRRVTATGPGRGGASGPIAAMRPSRRARHRHVGPLVLRVVEREHVGIADDQQRAVGHHSDPARTASPTAARPHAVSAPAQAQRMPDAKRGGVVDRQAELGLERGGHHRSRESWCTGRSMACGRLGSDLVAPWSRCLLGRHARRRTDCRTEAGDAPAATTLEALARQAGEGHLRAPSLPNTACHDAQAPDVLRALRAGLGQAENRCGGANARLGAGSHCHQLAIVVEADASALAAVPYHAPRGAACASSRAAASRAIHSHTRSGEGSLLPNTGVRGEVHRNLRAARAAIPSVMRSTTVLPDGVMVPTKWRCAGVTNGSRESHVNSPSARGSHSTIFGKNMQVKSSAIHHRNEWPDMT